MRRLLWRKLAKVDSKLKQASTMNRKANLLAEKWELEKQLATDFAAVKKENPKAFFSFSRSKQTTKATV